MLAILSTCVMVVVAFIRNVCDTYRGKPSPTIVAEGLPSKGRDIQVQGSQNMNFREW